MNKNINVKSLQSQAKEKIQKKESVFLSPKYLLSGIVLLIIIIYSNAMHNSILTFDDNDYFNNYPELTKLSWSSIKLYFTNYYLIMYQPLPVLTLAVNHSLSAFNPFPMHVFNLAFHIMNTLLVYQFIKLLVKNINIALIVTLLFAIHPMNVEAVSWISARSSSMYTFFYLCALIYYLKYITQEMKLKHLFLAALFFIFSLFSKAQAVTLPVIMLLIDYYYNRKLFSKRVIIEKIPFLILSILFGLITLNNKETMENITTGMVSSYNPLDIFFIVCHSFVFYITKLIYPVGLCSIYVYPPKVGGMLPITYYLSAFVFVFILYLVFRFRKNKNILFGAGLFFITIAINIQLIPSRLFEVTDRYAYFPYIGLYLLILFYINYMKEHQRVRYTGIKPYLIIILVIYTFIFTAAVYSRNTVWANDETLMTDIINKNPESEYLYRAYGNRAIYYKTQNRVNEAIADLTQAIKLKPKDGRTYFNRALTYMMMNLNAEATADFDVAIQIDPKQPVLYASRTQTRLLMKDTTGSIADANYCLKLDSANVDAYNTLATIEYARMQYDLCEQHLTLALKYNPKFSLGFKNRGLLYRQQKRMDKACADFEQASELGNADGTSLHQQHCN